MLCLTGLLRSSRGQEVGSWKQQEEEADVSRAGWPVDTQTGADAPASNTVLTSVTVREKERIKLLRDIRSLAKGVVCFPTAG